MKADDAANATIIANGYGEALRSTAIASAIGAIKTAVAVFEMKRPNNAVATNSIPITKLRPGATNQGYHSISGQIDSTSPLQCN